MPRVFHVPSCWNPSAYSYAELVLPPSISLRPPTHLLPVNARAAMMASGLGFSADNASITARDIAKGNIVINGHGNIVHPGTSSAPNSSNPVKVTLTVLLDWLSVYSCDYFPAHEKARLQKALNSGFWFFGKKEYKDWAEGKGAHNLQCVGIPGAGKTTIASAVIETLKPVPRPYQRRNSSIVIYAYFKHDTQTTQTIPHVLASLLHQTIKQKGTMSQETERLYQDYSINKNGASHSSNKGIALPQDRLMQALKSELSSFKTVYIVVDGLDEYCVKDYSLSHPLVIELQLLGVKLLITSRHVVGFKANSFSSIRISAQADDIHILVERQMTGHLADIITGAPGLLDEIADTVVEKSRGMFIIAKLLVDSLSLANTANKVRALLQELPSDIQGTYRLTMTRVLDQEPHLAKLGLTALSWTYFARRRLLIRELRHAVSFEPGMKTISEDDLVRASRIMSACTGLITSVRKGNDDVGGPGDESECQFIHFTVKEFFDDFWKDYFPDGERQITGICLPYLTAAVSAIHPIPEKRITPVKWPEWRHFRMNKFALWHYAATFWGAHAKAANGPLFPLDAQCASLFRHTIGPYMATRDRPDGPNISPVDSMEPAQYWTLYFSRFGLLELLRRHFALIQHRDSRQGVSLQCHNARDGKGWSALHFSVFYGHLEVVEFLLDNGADLDDQINESNDSPLHLAVQAGSSGIAIVKLLLDRGAIVDQPNGYNKAPIHYALRPEHTSNPPSPQIIRLLLQHEVNIHRKEPRRYCGGSETVTPLSLAQYSNNSDIKQLLEEYARTHPRAAGKHMPSTRSPKALVHRKTHVISGELFDGSGFLANIPPTRAPVLSIPSERDTNSRLSTTRTSATGHVVDPEPPSAMLITVSMERGTRLGSKRFLRRITRWFGRKYVEGE